MNIALLSTFPVMALAIFALLGPSAHLLFPVLGLGILVAAMAVVALKPQEDDPRSEQRESGVMAVVAVPRDRQPRSGAMEALPDAGRLHEETARAVRPRALIIGSGAVAQTLAYNLERAGGYEVVGFVDDPASASSSSNMQFLGGRAATSSIVRDYAVDAVFIASMPSWQQELAESVVSQNPGVKVNIVPSFHEALMRLNRVESCGDIALVSLTPAKEWFNDAAKRVFDIASAAFGLIVMAPVLLAVGISIKLTSPGPVIFYQKRVGRDGKPFMLYKFRTMVMNAEAKTGPVLADGKADTRLTPVGRVLRMFRIDEFPQFWNVIRGDMSMVGPRPERPFFVEQFEQRLPSYSERHHVRPGITGLAQVHGGYHTDAEDKLRFDLIYVSQHSLWLDVSILLRTILVVCKPHR